jgi:hypothetical protein
MCVWKPNRRNLIKEILRSDFTDRKTACAYEAELITNCINDDLNQNYQIPGVCPYRVGMLTVKDVHGNKSVVSNKDPRYLSGELVALTAGMSVYTDVNGCIVYTNTNDNRVLSGELTHISKNKVVVKDKDNNYFSIDKSDPRYKNKELLPFNIGKSVMRNIDTGMYEYVDMLCDKTKYEGTTKGMVTVTDGNLFFNISVDEYSSTKYKTARSGKVTVKDAYGKLMTVKTDDPRLTSGELIAVTKNKVVVRDNNGNVFSVDRNDPRYVSGELIFNSVGKKHSEESREKMRLAKANYKGNNNPQFGTAWISNDDLKESRKVKMYDVLEYGWYHGKKYLSKKKNIFKNY